MPELCLRRARQALDGTPWRTLSCFVQQQEAFSRRVVVYDSTTRLVQRDAVIPWPIVFLLAQRGPKFIFGGSRAPRQRALDGSIAAFTRRIRTHFVFGALERRGGFHPKLFAPNVQWQPPPAPPAVEAAVSKFAERLRADFAALTCDPAYQERHRFGNSTAIDRRGLAVMRRTGWSAVRSDKDSSFVLLQVHDRAAELARVLHDAVHFELVATEPPEIAALVERTRASYLAATAAIAAMPRFASLAGGGAKLLRFLNHRAAQSEKQCISVLEFSLKTHKTPVKPRELEGGHRNFLQPGQRFMSVLLRSLLPDRAPWVVQDSREFVRRAETGEFAVPHGFVLMAGDIGQFFPSCEHGELLAAQDDLLEQAGFDRQHVAVAHRLSHVLLANQFACAAEVAGVYRRHLGAAMGAGQASEACDTYVALRHDQLMLSLVQAGELAWYVRFRDDALMCADPARMTEQRCAEVQAEFGRRGSNLVLELDRLPDGGASWLDLDISIGSGGRLVFSTHIKPTNLGWYLAADSYHSPTVLANWPRCELRRYARNSTHVEATLAPTLRLADCLRRRLYDSQEKALVHQVRELWSRRHELLHGPTQGRLRHHRSLLLVVPYHKCWGALRLRERLKEIEGTIAAHAPPDVVTPMSVSVGFANAESHLYVKVRRLHLQTASGGRRIQAVGGEINEKGKT